MAWKTKKKKKKKKKNVDDLNILQREKARVLQEQEWYLRKEAVAALWKSPEADRAAALAAHEAEHTARIEAAAKNQGVLTKAQKRAAEEAERDAEMRARISARRSKRDVKRLERAELLKFKLSRGEMLNAEEISGREWWSRRAERGIQLLSEISGWKMDRKAAREGRARAERAAAEAAEAARIDVPDRPYDTDGDAVRRRLGARALHSFAQRPSTAAHMSPANTVRHAFAGHRNRGSTVARPNTAAPIRAKARPVSRGGAWATDWGLAPRAKAADKSTGAWPPRPSTVATHERRKVEHQQKYTKALLEARHQGNLDPLPALSTSVTGFGSARLYRERGNAPRWKASAIVLSTDSLSPWAKELAKGLRREVPSAALTPTAKGDMPSLDSLRHKRRAQTADTARKRREHLHRDLANAQAGAKTALAVLHGGATLGALTTRAERSSASRRETRRRPATAASTTGRKSRARKRSSKSNLADEQLMFGIPKREALLLRRGRWDVLVIQLVAFDIKAMHTLIRSLDFLALVKSARVAVDLSHNHAVDSCVPLAATLLHHSKTPFTLLTSFPLPPFAPAARSGTARAYSSACCTNSAR